jgi:RHS repeat-associated protein
MKEMSSVNGKRIRYYQYDGNGNVTAEQEGPFGCNTGNGGTPTSGGYTVTDLGDDVSVIDQGWGMVDTPSNGGGGTPKNPTTRGYRRDYQWNERNLLKVSSDNRYTVQYTYGADGERTSKFSTSSTGGSPAETLYFNKMWSWRHDGLLSDRTGRNSKHIYVGETRLVTKIGRADGSFTNEEKLKQYWYHSDHLGSAQLISNVDGEEYERIEYTPYGELWIEKASAASNIDIPYRFTGKELDDETGLYYYGARYLDPKYSRWLSPDPALKDYIPGAPINDEVKKKNGELPGMGGVFNTVNLHLYHYAGNNPVKYTDPTGMWTFSVALSGSAAYGMGAQGSVGIAIGFSKKDGLSIGVFASGGITAGGPPSAGVGVTLDLNVNAESVHDLEGSSNSIGVSGYAIWGAGVDVATNENGTPSPGDGVSLTVGGKGTLVPIEGHASAGETVVAGVTTREVAETIIRSDVFTEMKKDVENFIIEEFVKPMLSGVSR